MKAPFNCIIALCLLLVSCHERPHRHVTISVLGDSLVAGYQIDKQEAFPAVLEAALRAAKYDVTVLNDGVSGNTTADGLARIDSVIAEKPDLVIVELGANDMLQHVNTQVTFDNLDRIVGTLKASKIAVLLTGMHMPANMDLDYKLQFDLIFPSIAEKQEVSLYAYFLSGIALDPRYNLPDMLHPNQEGEDTGEADFPLRYQGDQRPAIA